jgi:hypothetical protein
VLDLVVDDVLDYAPEIIVGVGQLERSGVLRHAYVQVGQDRLRLVKVCPDALVQRVLAVEVVRDGLDLLLDRAQVVADG